MRIVTTSGSPTRPDIESTRRRVRHSPTAPAQSSGRPAVGTGSTTSETGSLRKEYVSSRLKNDADCGSAYESLLGGT